MQSTKGHQSFRCFSTKPFSKESCTRFAIEPFTGQGDGKVPPLMGRAVASQTTLELTTAVPKRSPFASFPSLETIDGVGRRSFGVFVPAAGWRVQHGLGQHQQLLPRASAVGVGHGCQGTGKDT